MNDKNVWLSSAILIAIVLVVNLLAESFFVRFDLTESDKYSISDVTKATLASIDDPVTVKIYYSDNFPSQLISVKQYVLDMLEEYRAYAGSGLEYEFLELSSEDQAQQQEAMQYGVTPVQANITQSDEIKVQTIFLGLVFLYGDKREVIPFAQNIAQLEYDMTGAIKKLIAIEPPKIAWLTGHGQPELFGNREVEGILAEVRKNYQLVGVNLQNDAEIAADISVALLVNPTQPFEPAALYKLDQFLMRGGKLGAFVSGQVIDPSNQYFPVRPNSTNISEFLRNYGFEIDSRLVVDQQSYQVQAMQSLGAFQIPVAVPYAFAPRINQFDDENPIVSRMEEVGFFFVSEVKQVDGGGEGVSFTPLLKTSANSGYAMPDPRTQQVNINPGGELPEYMFKEGSLTIGAVVTGQFPSYFGAARPDTIEYSSPHIGQGQQATKVVAVGSGNFVEQQFQVPTAKTFFLNSIDWLYDESGLISIRSKEVAPKSLDETEASTRSLIKWTNVLLAPVLIVLFGLGRWFLRKRVKALAGGMQ